MLTLRENMNSAIKKQILPWLRSHGFKGSLPHFRRPTQGGIHLLTFQFDRNGGGLIIEIARCKIDGITTPWGKHIEPNKVTAWDVEPNNRVRIQHLQGSGTEHWFRFDDGNVDKCAQQILSKLPEAEHWLLSVETE
ncbi:MAG: DUF4304 domain-containing protein [Nitrosomonadales bacterium]